MGILTRNMLQVLHVAMVQKTDKLMIKARILMTKKPYTNCSIDKK